MKISDLLTFLQNITITNFLISLHPLQLDFESNSKILYKYRHPLYIRNLLYLQCFRIKSILLIKMSFPLFVSKNFRLTLVFMSFMSPLINECRSRGIVDRYRNLKQQSSGRPSVPTSGQRLFGGPSIPMRGLQLSDSPSV